MRKRQLRYLQALKRVAPAFAKDEYQEKYNYLQMYHMEQKAIVKITRAVRKELKRRGQYEGTKLAQMDEYGVKLSELGVNPIVLVPEFGRLSKTEEESFINRHSDNGGKGKSKKKKTKNNK